MTADAPQPGKKTGSVIFFPARRRLFKGKAGHSDSAKKNAEKVAPIGDLSEYERKSGADDYPHRMAINTVAFVFIVMLTVAGLWLADAMALLRKNQDCAFSGRSNCAELDLPPRTR